jgi:hypothetical protein
MRRSLQSDDCSHQKTPLTPGWLRYPHPSHVEDAGARDAIVRETLGHELWSGWSGWFGWFGWSAGAGRGAVTVGGQRADLLEPADVVAGVVAGPEFAAGCLCLGDQKIYGGQSRHPALAWVLFLA